MLKTIFSAIKIIFVKLVNLVYQQKSRCQKRVILLEFRYRKYRN